ncbi:fatty acid synthase-like [Manduca sexta]|uniref:fatty acid synthase-like n=1 Tax=Manduca sexta TaxID=7130 RepID=UPI00188E68AB|nr:fatty acid synthase-like [Manduca sexta]
MVPDLDRFDAQFFKVHYRLGISMDTMARKVLEQSYQAIYDAGISPEQLSGRKVGVFIGSCFSETEKIAFYVSNVRWGFGIAGCNKAMFANRISYWLNAKGPSVSIDEACCSSLGVLQQAYLAIKRGDCESAIVGGAHVCLHPQSSLHYSRIMALCRDGKTKSFDQNADGFAKSEAVNVLFIQKAKDALRIYGEVRHIKCEFTQLMNTESGPRYGFYREPRVMINFLKNFYEESGVPPSTVEYVEAFGSAVADADKSELEVIDEVFCKDREHPLMVGSVMSNIGYGEAASGISSITKVLLGYHKGLLAGNLHCETPRRDVEAVREGRLQILTDHAPFGGSYAAVNGISVTGLNAHVLLHGHYKPKDLNRYKCDIPRLVTISGRHESAVKKIIDDLKSRPVDPEELALLHNVFKTKITGHMARGLVILDTKGDSTVSLHEKVDYFDNSKQPLWFVYSGMGSQWVGMGTQLMRIPIFAAAIERCDRVLAPKGINIVDIITSEDKTTFDNILHSFVGIAAIQIGLTDVLHALGIVPDKIIGHSVGELGCAYADGCLTAEEMILSAYSRGFVSVQTPFIRGSMVAVGLGYRQISKMCPPEIEVACHNSSESSTISGPTDVMREFIGVLTAKGIFAKEVPCSNIAYHSRYIAEAGPALLKHLEEVIKTPRARSERWVSTSVPQDRWNEPIAKLSSAEYHTNNLLSSVLFEETAALIPPNAVLVEIAPHGLLQTILMRLLPGSCCNIALTRRGHPDNAYLVLEAIGKLYMAGYTPKVEAIYPKVEFPVSSSTPMLSHTVEWAHEEKWPLPLYTSAHRKMAASCKFVLNVYDEEHSYLRGHVMRGKTLYPFAAALVAVWDTLAMFMGVPKKEVSVEFRDVHLFAQPVLHEQRQLRLSVDLHRGTGRFEVLDDNSKVATGFIDDKCNKNIKSCNNNDIMNLTSEDIYTLLNNRDYSYSGDFRSIHSANSSITEALILWRENWVTLLDGLLQLNALRHTHDGVSVPKQIGRMCINVSENTKHHMDLDGETVIRTKVSDVYKYTSCGGILIEHLKLRDLPLESRDNFAIKSLQFVPRFSAKLDFVSTLHVYLQIVAENLNRNYINIASLVTYKDARIFKEIKNILIDINNVNFKHKEVSMQDIKENNDALADIDLVLLYGLSIDDNICHILYQTLKPNSFVVSEEDNTMEKRIRPSAVYRTVSAGDELQLVRWRSSKVSSNRLAVSVSSASDIPLVTATRDAMQPQAQLLVLAPQPPPQGLKDLVRTWRTERVRNQVSLVVMDTKCTDEQMDTNIELAFNVWNKCQWGGEYYVPLQEKYETATRGMLQSARIGDISSLHWVQVHEPLEVGVKVKVHYAGLNTVDVLKATGAVPMENENESTSSGYGMDFSGVTESGTRVMGVVSGGACSSEVRAAPELLWPVPEHWTLEDAATVPLPYLRAFYCFLRTISRDRTVDKSEASSLFVHGGVGALGQAAISIGLGLGYQVFTTVSDVAKKQFLMRLFPQLKEENIGNSRDNSFGDSVLRATNGKGCYIVINNVRGDMKNVSLQCCSGSGTTYDMCQLIHHENYMFPMSYLFNARSYVSLDISSILKNWIEKDIKMLHAMVSEGIARGYVRPLSRVSYAPHAAPRALRLLAASAHRGRVLLHLRDSRLHVLPRISCKPDEVQLILSDRSSLGLHLADRLINRGARKLHMHCTYLTPHLHYKIRSWQQQGVLVEASSEDFNDEGISTLMQNVCSLGTVSGIYVTATDASANSDKKYLSALNTLDLVSRRLCPYLRYFAVISSDMTAMHTCIDRVSNGYPATLLKFNFIETSIANEGGFELSASQWLGVVAAAERALHSPHPALLAHQLRAPHAPLLQQIAHVAG